MDVVRVGKKMFDNRAVTNTMEAVIAALLMLSAVTFVMLSYAPFHHEFSAVQLQEYGEDTLTVLSFYPKATIEGNTSWTDSFNNEGNISDKNNINVSGGNVKIEGTPPSTNTYDFSSGAGNDKWAWEKLNPPSNPTDYGYPASSDDYTNISAPDDSKRWETNLATGDGEYNTQMYTFNINESPSSISEINVSWQGHGEDHSGYDTTLKIWKNSFWDELQMEDAMGSEGWLTGTVTKAEDFISGANLTVLAQAEHYEGGCPYIYGWDGEEYEFLDALFPGSFNERYEMSSFATTTDLAVKNEYYEAIIFMSLPEDGYINDLNLYAVDHPENTIVLPDDYGIFHTIKNPLPLSAVDREGKNITEMLITQDHNFWGSNLSTNKDFNDTSNLYDWFTLTLPKNDSEAKLLVNMRITAFAELKLWYYNHYMLGTPNQDYLLNLIKTDEDFANQLDQMIFETISPLIQFWNGTSWYTYSYISNIPFIYFEVPPKVIPLNLTENVGNQIRIVIPFACFDFDYIAVDYSADMPVNVTSLAPIGAEKHYVNGTIEDVIEKVTDTDSDYALVTQGDYIKFRFPTVNPAEGFDRTYIFSSSGYYNLMGSVVPEDKMYNLDLLYNLTYTPYAYTKWMIPRYLHPENYPYAKYFHISGVKEPFPFKGHSSLHSNYIKVVVVSGKGYKSSANLTSVPINISSSRCWNKLYAHHTLPPGTSITYKVLNAADNSTICDNITAIEAEHGYDISSCAYGTRSIRLYAELATSDCHYTPTLHDWTVDLRLISELERAVENADWEGLDEKINKTGIIPDNVEYNFYFLDNTGEIMRDGNARVEHGLPGRRAISVNKLVYARAPEGYGYNIYEMQLILWYK